MKWTFVFHLLGARVYTCFSTCTAKHPTVYSRPGPSAKPWNWWPCKCQGSGTLEGRSGHFQVQHLQWAFLPKTPLLAVCMHWSTGVWFPARTGIFCSSLYFKAEGLNLLYGNWNSLRRSKAARQWIIHLSTYVSIIYLCICLSVYVYICLYIYLNCSDPE